MEIDSENLISLVFARSALWDKTLKQYRNRNIVDKLWRQASAELGADATTEAVKEKWENLRNSFSKELRKIPERRSGDEGPLNFETYTTWPYFYSMLFLKDQLKARKTGGNLSAGGGAIVDDLEDGEQSVTGTIPEEQNENEIPETVEIDSVADVIPQTSSHRSNRPGKRGVQQQLVDIEARKLRLLERKTIKSSAGDDEDESFFKSSLPHVRKLKPEEKLDFRMEVQSVVQRYVYKKNRLLNDPNMHSNRSLTPLQNHVPFSDVGINTPLLPFQQSTPPRQQEAGIITMEYHNEPVATENQYSTVISTERPYYSVITSPISSLTSQKRI